MLAYDVPVQDTLWYVWTRPHPKKHQALAIDAYPRIALIRQTDRQYGILFLFGERWVNPLPDEASRTKWEPEKKDPLRGSFFSYRPSAGTAPSAQHAFGALCLRRPPSQLDRPCSPPDVPLTTGSTLLLSTYSFLWPDNMDDRPYRVGERWVNPLPDEASSTKWEPEKKTHFVGLFFSYRPSAGTAPLAPPPLPIEKFKLNYIL